MEQIQQLTNEERVKSIIMSGERCSFGSNSVLNCHCNDCYNHIIGYLGKEKGKKYFYNGKFAPEYMREKYVIIEHFSTDEDEETNSCECFIKLANSEYGFEWIPRKEILNNLREISIPPNPKGIGYP